MSRLTLFAVVALTGLTGSLQAAPTGAALLPGSTKLHVSIPDVLKLEEAWKSTKLSQLFEDPKLKPWLKEVTRESGLGKIGLDWEDLRSVATGELSVAALTVPEGQAGHVMTLDVKDKKTAMVKVLGKLVVALQKQGYKVHVKQVAGFPVTALVRAAQDKNERDQEVLYFAKDDLLVVADHEKAAEAILQRWGGTDADRLDQVRAYQEVRARTQAKMTAPGDLFWFVEPIGLAELARAGGRPSPRRGPDPLKVAKAEGFAAFQGVGGFVALGQGDHDVTLHTAVYAPPPYYKAMRMVQSLPGGDFAPPSWVSADAAVFATLYADVSVAFNNFGSLFDALYGDGDAGTFDDILKGLRDDPNGPRVDVGKDLIGRLGQRLTLVTHTAKPLGPHSARMLLAVEAKDEKGVGRALQALMENDEDVKRHTLAGDVTLWEMIPRVKKKKGDKQPAEQAKAPGSALAVARGQLFLASNVKLLEQVLTSSGQGLEADGDYQRVAAKLGTAKDSLRGYVRPDLELQNLYELMRTGQVDKSSTLPAQLLTALVDVKKIDGGALPPYEAFVPYLGPVGISFTNQPDGWLIAGFALKKK